MRPGSARSAPRGGGAALLVFLLSFIPAGDEASAFETPAQRWDYWTLRATGNVRTAPRLDAEPDVMTGAMTASMNDSTSGLPAASGPARSARVRLLSTIGALAVCRFDPTPGRPPRPSNRAAYATRPPAWSEADGLRVGDDPLFVLEQGIALRLWGADWSSVGPRWTLRGVAQLQARSGGPWLGRAPQINLARRGGRHDIVLGAAPIRWGDGIEGSLLLGRTAPPMPQLRWTTARPLRLPSRLRLPGTWTGDHFLAYLHDDDRTIPRPLLLGHRLAWQPIASVEVAGARTILFGGRGRTRRLTPRDLGHILLGRRENVVGARGPGDSDQRASFSLRATLPAAWKERLRLEGGELFWEYAGEDMIDPPIPAAVAHHYGAAAVWRGWELRTEISESTSENRWYDRHTVYGDAHFYRGLPLGMSHGSDVVMMRGGITTPPAGARMRLTRAERLHGETSGSRELRVSWQAEAIVELSERWIVEAELSRTRRIGDGRDPTAPPLQRSFAALWVTHRPIPAP